MIERVHYPECNVGCSEHGHWLLPSGPQGEPFSHQDVGDVAARLAAGSETAATRDAGGAGV